MQGIIIAKVKKKKVIFITRYSLKYKIIGYNEVSIYYLM